MRRVAGRRRGEGGYATFQPGRFLAFVVEGVPLLLLLLLHRKCRDWSSPRLDPAFPRPCTCSRKDTSFSTPTPFMTLGEDNGSARTSEASCAWRTAR